MIRFLKPIVKYKSVPEIYICQRFKGHSKWQNIRHIKEAKDAEKSALSQLYIKRMKIAIAGGGSTDPMQNDRLGKIIAEIKKTDLPNDLVKNFLKKMDERKENSSSKFLTIKGPGRIYLLIHLLTDNIRRTKQYVNIAAKKSNVTVLDQIPKGLFIHKGIVTTSLSDLDKATEDAINCDAEEVEEISEDNTKYLQFTCDAKILMSVKSQLEKYNYNVIKIEDTFFPQSVTAITEEQGEELDKLFTRLESIEEVVAIYHNVE